MWMTASTSQFNFRYGHFQKRQWEYFLGFFLSYTILLSSSFWTSRVVTDVVPSPPRFLPSAFITHRVQQIPLLIEFLLSVDNSRSRAFRKSICAQQKSLRTCTTMHSKRLELTKLTYYTRLEVNLIRHRDDYVVTASWVCHKHYVIRSIPLCGVKVLLPA